MLTGAATTDQCWQHLSCQFHHKHHFSMRRLYWHPVTLQCLQHPAVIEFQSMYLLMLNKYRCRLTIKFNCIRPAGNKKTVSGHMCNMLHRFRTFFQNIKNFRKIRTMPRPGPISIFMLQTFVSQQQHFNKFIKHLIWTSVKAIILWKQDTIYLFNHIRSYIRWEWWG